MDALFPITLNFHPDQIYKGLPLLKVLAAEGVYRSQFETGTSNGGLTAHEGGDRWFWESRIFNRAYDEVHPSERPKYGALNYRRRATGGAPRFGSAHLRLRPDVLQRSTFCYPDSVFHPEHFGVIGKMGLLAQALRDNKDLLDDYIEAHIHGPVRLLDDVEALVLDPCYRGTETEYHAHQLPCSIEWHAGFRMTIETLRQHPEYRGQQYVDIGVKIAHSGYIDPAAIGRALRAAKYEPQDLKKVWHCLARYGDLSFKDDSIPSQN